MKKVIALVLSMVMAMGLVACGGATVESHELKIGQALYAAHGTKCFTTATVVVEGEKVVKAYIDEYQYMSTENTVGVPNSENYADVAEGYQLVSKRVNNAVYSENMKKAESTVEIAANYDAIQAYAEGKTVAELKAVVDAGEGAVDMVSGCTLVDTAGYVGAIIAAVEEAADNAAVTYEGSLEGVELKQINGAAHGTKCFAVTTVLVSGETVILAHIDEFQFMATEGTVGVPNSENFTAYVAEGKQLVSKRVNNAVYSENMKKAGSTVEIAANYDAVQAHAAGKTIADLQTVVDAGEGAVDLVSGCTLVDAAGYMATIVEAAK